MYSLNPIYKTLLISDLQNFSKRNKKYNYTYQIYNFKEKMFYIGKHSSNISPENDLGIKYFSSMRKETGRIFILDQKKNPQNYEYTILTMFHSAEEALLHEEALHRYFNVDKNKRFYNKAKQTSKSFSYDRSGENNTEEQKKKFKQSIAIYWNNNEEKRKKFSENQRGEKNHRYGKIGTKYGTGLLIRQYDLKGNFLDEGYADDFIKKNYHISGIYRCCKGERKTHRKCVWEFA